MRREFKDCYENLVKDGLKHFKNMQHVKLKAIKACNLKAFNTNFMSKIVQKQKKRMDNSDVSSDGEETSHIKSKVNYNLGVISIEDSEKIQIVECHDCDHHESEVRKIAYESGVHNQENLPDLYANSENSSLQDWKSNEVRKRGDDTWLRNRLEKQDEKIEKMLGTITAILDLLKNSKRVPNEGQMNQVKHLDKLNPISEEA